MRIAVVGAGVSGLTLAWLLDETRGAEEVTLYTGGAVGGHAESIATEAAWVDPAAQHLAPGAFPVHTELLRALGLEAALVEAPLSTTIRVGRAEEPVLVTPHPSMRGQPASAVAGKNLRYLGDFLARAGEMASGPDSWWITSGELVDSLGLPAAVERDVVYPLLASFVGCSVERARDLSLPAAVAFLVRNAPDDPEQPPRWANLSGGLGRLAAALLAELRSGSVLRTEVVRVSSANSRWRITDIDGRVEHFDRVVFAASPESVLAVLDEGCGPGLSEVLRRFHHVSATLAVHRDPCYVDGSPKYRSTNNITVSADRDGNHWAETSTWYGPITGENVFKSWITHRSHRPESVIAEREYRHPVPTVDHVAAQRALLEWQGSDGLYCVGSWTVDVDSQESAVRSAVSVARELAPEGDRLRRLSLASESPV
ncbi:hypothetical protein CDG81_15235 [Actinopolyspora erythraea]|uniref:Amine oxidase domain-containing protein n=1 Tax=Actinopolyspora erythraea TaxID=414996 RepID=A0A099D6I8_9ACTN|nr:NAD(P)-binding protein [Actinopolyspora erythraea]ASU79414.1 hypothetical protein CDG81_15235 [Actinopolyspora erythraea]KGI80970.1 hypothetical protein IL38_14520 [Actinopolyspora erythraea]